MRGVRDDRLDSWKEIAAYLKRDVATVRRWEKREGLPIHRHLHNRLGSVYAYAGEVDAWLHQRHHLSELTPKRWPYGSVGIAVSAVLFVAIVGTALLVRDWTLGGGRAG